MSTAISPACRAGLQAIPPNSIGWKEAAFASGDLVASRALLFQKYMTMKTPWDLVGGFSVTDIGSYDACMSIADKLYTYCDIQTKAGPLIRWGACVPKGCGPKDIATVLLPAAMSRELHGRCGDSWKLNHHAAAVMGGIIILLIILAVIGTVLDLSDSRLVQLLKKNDGLPGAIEMGPSVSNLAPNSSVLPPVPRSFGKYDRTRSSLPRPSNARELVRRVLHCFSLIGSARALCSTRRGPFQALDGIRSLSVLYIILGHVFVVSFMTLGYSNIEWAYEKWILSVSATLVTSSVHAIGTFLYLSGFLAVTLFSKHLLAMRTNRGVPASNCSFAVSIPMLYLHRWIRLIPAFVFIVAVYLCLGPFVTEGPMTAMMQADQHNCRRRWWMSMLFISNFGVNDLLDMCYPASWYLNLDLQLWLTTPFFVLLGVNYRRVGYAVAFALVAASMAYTAYKCAEMDMSINVLNRTKYLAYEVQYFIQPLNRLPAYYIGCATGLLWAHHGKDLQRIVRRTPPRKLAVWLTAAYLTCGTLLAIPVFGTRGAMTLQQEWEQASMTAYITLAEPCWAVGLAIFTLILVLRLGGPIQDFLEAPIFLLLSRLCFTAYLIHPAILGVWSANFINQIRLSDMGLYILTFGVATMSFLFGTAVFLLVEKPFADLSRMLLREERAQPGTSIHAKSSSKIQSGEGEEEPQDGVAEMTRAGSSLYPWREARRLSDATMGALFSSCVDPQAESEEEEEELDEDDSLIRHDPDQPWQRPQDKKAVAAEEHKSLGV